MMTPECPELLNADIAEYGQTLQHEIIALLGSEVILRRNRENFTIN